MYSSQKTRPYAQHDELKFTPMFPVALRFFPFRVFPIYLRSAWIFFMCVCSGVQSAILPPLLNINEPTAPRLNTTVGSLRETHFPPPFSIWWWTNLSDTGRQWCQGVGTGRIQYISPASSGVFLFLKWAPPLPLESTVSGSFGGSERAV